MVTIKVILGSTRPNRFGIQPAEWITELGKQFADKATFELVDLKEVNLPMLDVPAPPMMIEAHETEHAKAWSKIIDSADGFVFVTPEYNHSYPASLKNAFDYLHKEWKYKPVSFLSYGAAEGGARAVEHLRTIVSQLSMYDLSKYVSFPNYFGNLDEQGKYKFSDGDAEKGNAMLQDLVFWAEQMKDARTKLQ